MMMPRSGRPGGGGGWGRGGERDWRAASLQCVHTDERSAGGAPADGAAAAAAAVAARIAVRGEPGRGKGKGAGGGPAAHDEAADGGGGGEVHHALDEVLPPPQARRAAACARSAPRTPAGRPARLAGPAVRRAARGTCGERMCIVQRRFRFSSWPS